MNVAVIEKNPVIKILPLVAAGIVRILEDDEVEVKKQEILKLIREIEDELED